MRRRVKSREDFFETWDQMEQSEFARGVLSIESRFPGPAGLLPRLQTPGVLAEQGNPITSMVERVIAAAEPSTPPDRSILTLPKEPWRELVRELELDPSSGLLEVATIEWVDQRYPLLEEKDKTIPFLAGVVEEDPIRATFQDSLMTVKLMDATGSILVSLDPKIVTLYGVHLKKGSALAMTDVNVLRVSSCTKMIVLPLRKLVSIASVDMEGDVTVVRHAEDFNKMEAEKAFAELNRKLSAAGDG